MGCQIVLHNRPLDEIPPGIVDFLNSPMDMLDEQDQRLVELPELLYPLRHILCKSVDESPNIFIHIQRVVLDQRSQIHREG